MEGAWSKLNIPPSLKEIQEKIYECGEYLAAWNKQKLGNMQKNLYQAQSVLKKIKEDDPRGSDIPKFCMAQA